MSSFNHFSMMGLCLFTASVALAAPGCDAVQGDDAEAVQPRFTPPFDPTPKDLEGAPAGCVCPDLYAPVCGVDGGTYPNECEAGCAGVAVEHAGSCETEGCANDGDCTLNEFCDFGASCGGASGTCEPRPDFCYRKHAPVCGCDGETYENSCTAHVAGVSVAQEGECPEEDACVCTDEYAPVCGVDGQTYGNDCNADCAGVEVAHVGECELLVE